MGSFPETCIMIHEMVLVRRICLTVQTFFTLVIIFYILITIYVWSSSDNTWDKMGASHSKLVYGVYGC